MVKTIMPTDDAVLKDLIPKLLAAFQELYDELNRAFWVATTIETKDRLHGLAEAVFKIITDINRGDFGSRTKEFRKFLESTAPVKKRLEMLRDDVDKIIHSVAVAAQLLKSVTKVLNLIAPIVA